MTGRAIIEHGKWRIKISYKKEDGTFGQKTVSTGLDEKGNKRAAEAMIPKIVAEFEERLEHAKTGEEKVCDLLFADYLEQWLENTKAGLAATTRNTYSKRVKVISADFRSKGITLLGLRRDDIKDYYLELQKQGKSMRECWHRNIIIRASIYAAMDDSKYSSIIKSNPAAMMGRNLKIVKYQARYFNASEMKKLFDVLDGDRYEWLYKMTALYGLRRSEILGLKWNAIDFENNKVIIQHTVT